MLPAANWQEKYWTVPAGARCSVIKFKGPDNLRNLLLIVIFFLTACSNAPDKPEGSARKAAETNTQLGRNYMDRGQYEIALEKLKKAVAFDRTYAPAHTMLGVLYETIGDTEQAGREYKLALEYDPEDGSTNNNYGAYLCATGKGKDADRYFTAAIKDPFYPTPAIALANAGSCALERGDMDKAEAFLRQSLAYDGQLGSSLLPMAEINYAQGNYLRARAFLQRYQALGEMDEESLYLGYQIEKALGDDQSADEYRSDLLRLFPNSVQAGRTASRE